jgi:hypothetical protein
MNYEKGEESMNKLISLKNKNKQKGEKTMNTKKLIGALLVVGMMAFGLGKLEAASTDSIQLIVTPAVNYSVQITSADADIAYNFGTVDLNSTTLSERPAVVTNNGNVTSEWQVSAQVETGAGGWTLGESVGGIDAAVLKALFNSNGGAVPESSDFDTVNGSTLTVAAKPAEDQTLSSDTAITSNIPVSGQRDLYFMLHTPESATSSGQQTFRVYVTAVAP